MFKVNAKTYQGILEAVLKCAMNCYSKGVEGAPAVSAIEEEYHECVNEIYKLLGGKQNEQ